MRRPLPRDYRWLRCWRGLCLPGGPRADQQRDPENEGSAAKINRQLRCFADKLNPKFGIRPWDTRWARSAQNDARSRFGSWYCAAKRRYRRCSCLRTW